MKKNKQTWKSIVNSRGHVKAVTAKRKCIVRGKIGKKKKKKKGGGQTITQLLMAMLKEEVVLNNCHIAYCEGIIEECKKFEVLGV